MNLRNLDLRLVGMRLLAPIAALALALVVSGLLLELSGNDALHAFSTMWEFGTRRESLASTTNRAVPLYLSGLAVAIGFKMGLFNIGVEGQFTIAALFAAYVGAAVTLPAPLHIGLIVAVAMIVGGIWSGIAGALKVTRGVHEVLSTIMLNIIATGVVSYLLANYFLDRSETSLQLQTKELSASGRFPTLNWLPDLFGKPLNSGTDLDGFVVVAALFGVLFYVLVWRTRFGYDLRASGLNPFAAQASGVPPKPMVMRAMLLSGAVAGLVGMPSLLGFSYDYNLDFPTDLGFTGITVALLGRNHPVGIAFGAFLFGFLDRSAQILDLEGIPKEIVVIMQGVIVLSVIVAYEIVQRRVVAQQQQAAAEADEPDDNALTAGAGVTP